MRINKSYILLTALLCFWSISYSQIGGDGVFKFLNLPNSARIAALGGTYPVSQQRDISSGFQNPSLINKADNGSLSLNYSNYISDINFGALQYNFKIRNENFASTLLYINYGNFEEADATGYLTGNTFSGGDYLLNIGYGKNWQNKIYYGANLKVIYGAYDSYNSFALATDISATYKDSTSNFSGGIIFRNIGYQLKPFDNKREHLPFEIALAISQKLRHAPFRYHITYRNLQKFNLNYSDPNDTESGEDLFDENDSGKTGKGENLIRHFVLGGEFLLSESFNIQAGYNFQRSKELSINGTGGLPGFSAGFSVHLKKLSFSYAHSRLNVAGGNNYFSLQLQPSLFSGKKY